MTSPTKSLIQNFPISYRKYYWLSASLEGLNISLTQATAELLLAQLGQIPGFRGSKTLVSLGTMTFSVPSIFAIKRFKK